MGCCQSNLEENKPKSLDKTPQFPCVSKSPPRPEEETVKEVLSETPKSKPKPKPEPKVAQNVEEPGKGNILVSPIKPLLDHKLSLLEHKMSIAHEVKTPEAVEEEVEEEEISEALSETISNNTLDGNAVKDSASSSSELLRPRGYRSQGHFGHFHNYANTNTNSTITTNNNNRINHGRSPARRADPSPPRKRYPGPGLGPGPGPGARRSRSPAARGNVGRSPSGRRAGPSPGRVRMVSNNNSGPVAAAAAAAQGVSKNEESEEGVSESLENPLVSLECFIFL